MLVKVELKKKKLSLIAGEHQVQSTSETPGKTKKTWWSIFLGFSPKIRDFHHNMNA